MFFEPHESATVNYRLVPLPVLWLAATLPIWAAAEQDSPGPASTPGALHLVNRQQINPYNVIHVPRPNPGSKNVPLRTSYFVMVGTHDPGDEVNPDTVRIELHPDSSESFPILDHGSTFPKGYSGSLFQTNDSRYGPALAVYVESEIPLNPETQYQITVGAESACGARLPADGRSWAFTTGPPPETVRIAFSLDLSQGPDVHWQGEFFSGLAKSAFCTSSRSRLPHYDLIAEAQKTYPRAWNLQRDAYLSGFEHHRNPFKNLPNIVREKETRRITAMSRGNGTALLHVEGFYGHEQYGIPSNRPLTDDYHPGDEVLIADGAHSARAHVVAADDIRRVVKVSAFSEPDEGWSLEYAQPLPVTENPHAPGLFPPGGTYLRKFDPVGTPHYYWGRLNHEWDIVHGEYGRRVIPRFADAIGCLAIDGQAGTTAKDLVQHHEVTRKITSHLIERYGDAALDWPWVILNEPDLTSLYWRNGDWKELQRFYDYTSDAILRAFEDHGYDSHRVQVGGLELGAIWGAQHLRLDEFLIHCSPSADGEGALTHNAAYADPRLDKLRSRRVEHLCAQHAGRGAPLDFLSVHTYNASDVAAEKLIESKKRALEIDPGYYAALPIVSHETVPTWRPILDPGAVGMYLGNGYFTSWMADYQGRLLRQGASDARYALGGDLLLMHWPGIARNFVGLNDTVREIQLADRTEVVPDQSHHFVNLLSTLGHAYWVFPMEHSGAHAVSGFASHTGEDLRILVYAHHHEDTASLADAEFETVLKLRGLMWDRVNVTEYQFDRNHNSYFPFAKTHRMLDESERARIYSDADFAEIERLTKLRPTAIQALSISRGRLNLPVRLSANGTNFIILKPHPQDATP